MAREDHAAVVLKVGQVAVVGGAKIQLDRERDARELAGRTANNRVVNFAGDPRLIHSYAEVAIKSALPHSLRGELIPGLQS